MKGLADPGEIEAGGDILLRRKKILKIPSVSYAALGPAIGGIETLKLRVLSAREHK